MADAMFVSIPIEEYTKLLNADRVLDALYAGGVDNWEWFGEAMSALEDEEEA